MTVLAFGRKKNWKFNTAVIGARKSRPLFFSKPKLVQNIGLCGNSRLPAAQLRKPHDKANLRREESVCLLKVSQSKREGKKRRALGFLELLFSLSGQPVCLWGASQRAPTPFLEKPQNDKCEQASSRPPRCLAHQFSAPPASGSCEQLEVDFPSVSDHSVSISGLGAPAARLSSPARKQDSPPAQAWLSLFFCSSLTVAEASLSPPRLRFGTTAALNNSKLTALTGIISVGDKMRSLGSLPA